ncbi:hypothetical protein Tco_0372877, partial [Tanacetum coccineum]
MSPSSEKERMKMSRVLYASAVGSLMSAMICTTPVGVVSRYMAKPGREHWEAVKRILRYVKGTSGVALCFEDSNLNITGYVDSDYACDLDGSKSTTGYVFALSGGTVSLGFKTAVSCGDVNNRSRICCSCSSQQRSSMVEDVVGRSRASTRENYS